MLIKNGSLGVSIEDPKCTWRFCYVMALSRRNKGEDEILGYQEKQGGVGMRNKGGYCVLFWLNQGFDPGSYFQFPFGCLCEGLHKILSIIYYMYLSLRFR